MPDRKKQQRFPTFRQILFFRIDAVTSSSLELNTGLISERKYVSKSIGTLAALTSNKNHTITFCSSYRKVNTKQQNTEYLL